MPEPKRPVPGPAAGSQVLQNLEGLIHFARLNRATVLDALGLHPFEWDASKFGKKAAEGWRTIGPEERDKYQRVAGAGRGSGRQRVVETVWIADEEESRAASSWSGGQEDAGSIAKPVVEASATPAEGPPCGAPRGSVPGNGRAKRIAVPAEASRGKPGAKRSHEGEPLQPPKAGAAEQKPQEPTCAQGAREELEDMTIGKLRAKAKWFGAGCDELGDCLEKADLVRLVEKLIARAAAPEKKKKAVKKRRR